MSGSFTLLRDENRWRERSSLDRSAALKPHASAASQAKQSDNPTHKPSTMSQTCLCGPMRPSVRPRTFCEKHQVYTRMTWECFESSGPKSNDDYVKSIGLFWVCGECLCTLNLKRTEDDTRFIFVGKVKRTEIVPDVHLSAQHAHLDDGLTQEIIRFFLKVLLHSGLYIIIFIPHTDFDTVCGIMTLAVKKRGKRL